MSIDLSGGVVDGQPGTPSVDPSASTTTGSQAGSVFNDSLTPSIGLNVQSSVVDTTPGMPLLEWATLISTATNDFRHLLYKAEQELEASQLDFSHNVILSMENLLTVLNEQITLSLAWNDPKTGKPITVENGYDALRTEYDTYNTNINSLSSADQAAINQLNQAYADYENTPASDLQTSLEQQDVITKLNDAITQFDAYAKTRPSLASDANIPPISADTTTFNNNLGPINQQINQINNARTSANPPLSQYDTLKSLPVPNPQPEYPSINQQNAFTGPATPQDVTQYLSFFNQNVTSYRNTDLQNAIDAVITANAPQNEQAQDLADVAAAFANASGSTEQDFFTSVQNNLTSSLGATGASFFAQAIFNVPPVGVPTTAAEIGDVSPLPKFPGTVGTVPQLTINDFMMSNWIPLAIPLIALIQILQGHLSLFQALVDQENFLKQNKVGYINYPSAYIQRTNRAFEGNVGNVASSGSGVGLGSFAVGLQTRRLESVLSNAITKTIAQHNDLPVSSKVFIRTHYSTLDILQKSALLGSLPAATLFSHLLGWEGATDQTLALGLSIGFSERLANVIQSNTSRALTNGTFNQISFSSRLASQIAQDQVATGHTQLQDAINTGDPDLVNNAVSNLAVAQSQLSGATHLYNTFGSASVGGMAQVTDQVSSTMNLSMLSVALAQFGQTIGLPGFVPQFFANFTGLPTDSIVGALSSGQNIGDVLDNPLSMLFLKQSLLDSLNNQGISSPDAPGMINNAVNNVVLSGDMNTPSQLQAQLVDNFRQQGFGQMDAFSLAAAASGTVLGDVGVQNLNTGIPQGINAPAVASAVVNGINFNTGYPDLNNALQNQLGQPNLTGTLANAIDQTNGVDMSTQREFRNQIAQGLGSSGLSQAASLFLANSASSVVTNGTAASGTGSPVNDINALESALTTEIAHQFEVSVAVAAEIVKQALQHAFMTAPYSNPAQLNIAIQEGLVNAASNAGLSNAQSVLPNALAALPSNAGTILPLSELLDQVTGAINGIAKGHPHQAQGLNNIALGTVFGGTNAQEIQSNQNPLSLANLLNGQVQNLTAQQDTAQSDAVTQRLIQLIQAWTTPNAAIGYVVSSLTDHPTTFISNIAMAGQNKRDLDIPV